MCCCCCRFFSVPNEQVTQIFFFMNATTIANVLVDPVDFSHRFFLCVSWINLDLVAVIFMVFVLIVVITHCGKHPPKSVRTTVSEHMFIYLYVCECVSVCVYAQCARTWNAVNLFIDDYILSYDISATNNNKTNRNDRTTRTTKMTWISCCVYICFSADIVITIISIIALAL